MLFMYNEFIFESTIPKSKSQLKNEEWHKNNPMPVGTIIKLEDLNKYGIPDGIQTLMKEWPIIYKSPYSKSFYSSDNISWSHKPDESYRVSDHWNFISSRDGKVIKHCKTSTPVENNTHFSIGKYDRKNRIYNIILSEETDESISRKSIRLKKLKYLQDPDTIYKKKSFKQMIINGEVLVHLKYGLKDISGIVDKYTGHNGDLRIKNDNGDVIFTINSLDRSNTKVLDFSRKDGTEIENPFNRD